MEIGNKELQDFLLEFNRYLPHRIRIVAIGGTALTLLGKKASTKDIDFCFVEESDRTSFTKTAQRLGYSPASSNRLVGRGLMIDIYSNGYIFAVQLAEDYADKSIQIADMENIELRALAPMDLLITKAARLNGRDAEDIRTILASYAFDPAELVSRYIETMENSMVRDAPDHLLVLLRMVTEHKPLDASTKEKAERWAHGQL